MARSIYPETCSKYPLESKVYSFDFTNQPEVIAGLALSAPVITKLSGDNILTIGTPAVAGGLVQVRLSGGTTQTRYVLQCLVSTSGGDTLEGTGILAVL